jgi:glycosyltransferase involved in cell wall biosynthesis
MRPQWVLAPSPFLVRGIAQTFEAQAALVRPPITPPDERPPGREHRDGVLFVNPIPEKGLTLATELAARLPEVPSRSSRAGGSPGPVALTANVSLLPRRSSLRDLYLRAAAVIVPSVVEDAAPRVVSEAAMHGAVVIGSARGGIPELVVGEAFGPSDVGAWERRLRELLDDRAAWTRVQARQRVHACLLHADPLASLVRAGLPV